MTIETRENKTKRKKMKRKGCEEGGEKRKKERRNIHKDTLYQRSEACQIEKMVFEYQLVNKKEKEKNAGK